MAPRSCTRSWPDQHRSTHPVSNLVLSSQHNINHNAHTYDTCHDSDSNTFCTTFISLTKRSGLQNTTRTVAAKTSHMDQTLLRSVTRKFYSLFSHPLQIQTTPIPYPFTPPLIPFIPTTHPTPEPHPNLFYPNPQVL